MVMAHETAHSILSLIHISLHELVVLYRGKLTGILADKVPEGKHMKEFAAETLTKAAEFERVQHLSLIHI